jgi:hypothetical protein
VRALAAVALGLLVSTGCGPAIENAPFSVRPDNLRAGDLLGPFDGVVVDAETDRPIAGATVFGAWAFEHGIGLRGPAGVREVAAETTADGRYQIASPKNLPSGGSIRLCRFTLVVYRRGYVGYRSDFKFGNGEIRHDFSQRANKVRLQKWQPSMQHREHLAFLGGGDAIAKVSAWEAQPASLEYEGHVGTSLVDAPSTVAGPSSSKLLDATPLLSTDEVRGVTGYAGDFEVGRLHDRVRSESYDSRHFKAKDKPEAFDVAVRVWSMGAGETADEQFRKLVSELPAAVPSEEIGDRSVRARGGDVLGLAFLLRDKGVVVQISCGSSQCTEAAMVLRLAKLVESHIGELAAPEDKGAEAGKAKQEGAP